MQKLGQHFLKNAEVLQKIVSALALADNDRVIEIGPGHGELTAPLVRAAQGKRCEIFCIEKDHALIGELEQFAAQENATAAGGTGDEVSAGARVTIIEGDALKLLPETIALFPHGASYKIVGNIPYYITGKLLRTISELEHKPERTVLLIQKEVAERICAAPPDMNRLAASVQFWADAEIVAHVPRKDFSPVPEVDSTVIGLNTKLSAEKSAPGFAKHGDATRTLDRNLDPALYYRAVRAIFAQPRKTLLNNLSAAAEKTAKKNDIAARIEKIGINPDARPQDLSIDQIASIARLGLWS
jgi:16S rRNA (adenine1518-N6/adenine1519-N6)-dimethyltransferase